MTTRITQLTVVQEEEPIFSEMATTITIQDEGGGEFVEIEQTNGKISIEPKEWPYMRDAIDRMMKECKKETKP